MRIASVLLLALVLSACSEPLSPASSVLESTDLVCTVAKVKDGDSFTCQDDTDVRLLSVDAPEMAQGIYGEIARDELLRYIPVGAVVYLEFDVERYDLYGRTLAYVYDKDERMINNQLALNGFVVNLSYSPNVRYAQRILSSVNSARAAGSGLWSTPAFDCLPVDFRAGRCKTENS